MERVPGKFINGAGGPDEFHHHRLVIFFSCYLRPEAFVELCSQLSQKMTLCPGPPWREELAKFSDKLDKSLPGYLYSAVVTALWHCGRCRKHLQFVKRKYKMWNCGFQNTRIAVVNFTVVFERMFLRTKRDSWKLMIGNDWKLDQNRDFERDFCFPPRPSEVGRGRRSKRFSLSY